MAKRPKKPVADKPLPRAVRAPGTPATVNNTPAPAFDPAAKVEPGGAANPFTDGKADPAKSATAPAPPGPAPDNSTEAPPTLPRR